MAKTDFPGDPEIDRKLDEAMPLPEPDNALDDSVATLDRLYREGQAAGRRKSAYNRGMASTASVSVSGAPVGVIHQLLGDVMRAVSHVAKAAFNETQKYNFRGIDDVLNALGPALREHGVVPVPKLRKVTYRDTFSSAKQTPTREVTVEVTYKFTAPDGSYVPVTVPGESLDTSDKGTAKAMSVAYRIALIQLFALPTNEPTTDHDGQYLTRAGRSSLSNFEISYGRRLVTLLSDEQRRLTAWETIAADMTALAEFWPAILDANVHEQPIGADDPTTWHEAVAARFASEVEHVETADAGRFLHGLLVKLDGLGWRHKGMQLSAMMRTRGEFLGRRNVEAFNAAMAAIQAAASKEELASLSASIATTVELHHITEEQGAELHAVLHERAAKLPEKAPAEVQPEPAAEPDHPVDGWEDPWLPRSGEAWEAFKSRAEAATTHPAIMAVLEGADGPPAVSWGPDGLQRVRDAGNAACFRDRKISTDALAEIDAAIAEAARKFDVEWK